MMTAHNGALQSPQGLKNGPHPEPQLSGRGCLTCHANIHGSNAPSGSAFHE
jgi:hypothetical protein